MFYPSDEFDFLVAGFVSQGLSKAQAVSKVRVIEEQDALQYEQWLDQHDQDREIFAEFG